MKCQTRRHLLRFQRLVILTGALLLLAGGCPVDADALVTELLQAALDSISNSLVEALSSYLAGS